MVRVEHFFFKAVSTGEPRLGIFDEGIVSSELGGGVILCGTFFFMTCVM